MWSWVPGLAQAIADDAMPRYMENFYSVWFSQFPVPRGRKMMDVTYARRVEERQQVSNRNNPVLVLIANIHIRS